jgi:hypothetical protein
MTAVTASDLPEPLRGACAIWRVAGDTLTPAHIAWPEDELVLLIEILPAVGPRRAASEVVVELERGEQVRDRLRRSVDWSAGPAQLALRLCWGQRANGSSRLVCRVSVDGRPVGRSTVLLMPDGVDAQGRFREGERAALPSSATRLAYARALQGLLAGDGREDEKTAAQ